MTDALTAAIDTNTYDTASLTRLLDLLAAADADGDEATALAALARIGDRPRLLLTGGDRLRVRPPADAGFPLINLYGPTENAVVSTAGEVAAAGTGLPSIGRPLPYARVEILDADLRRLAAGGVGEHVLTPRVAGGCTATLRLTQRGPAAWLVGALLDRMSRRYVRLEAEGLKARSEGRLASGASRAR